MCAIINITHDIFHLLSLMIYLSSTFDRIPSCSVRGSIDKAVSIIRVHCDVSVGVHGADVTKDVIVWTLAPFTNASCCICHNMQTCMMNLL